MKVEMDFNPKIARRILFMFMTKDMINAMTDEEVCAKCFELGCVPYGFSNCTIVKEED